VSYSVDARVGVRVFDSRGFSDKSDAAGVRQWATVFSSTHDIDNEVIIGNGSYRIRIEPSSVGSGNITIEEFGSGTYGAVANTSGSTDVIEVDLSDVGLSTGSARILFSDRTETRLDVAGIGKPLLSGNIPQDILNDLSAEIENWPELPGQERTLFARNRLR
jgi:hypothetical protein